MMLNAMRSIFLKIKDAILCLFALLFILGWPLLAVLVRGLRLTGWIGPLLVRYKHWLLRLLNDAN